MSKTHYKRRPSEIHYKYHVPEPYYYPLMYCLRLFREGGKHMSDAIYITRLTFTDPSQPHYIPPERWNSVEFARHVRKWIKSD